MLHSGWREPPACWRHDFVVTESPGSARLFEDAIRRGGTGGEEDDRSLNASEGPLPHQSALRRRGLQCGIGAPRGATYPGGVKGPTSSQSQQVGVEVLSRIPCRRIEPSPRQIEPCRRRRGPYPAAGTEVVVVELVVDEEGPAPDLDAVDVPDADVLVVVPPNCTGVVEPTTDEGGGTWTGPTGCCNR